MAPNSSSPAGSRQSPAITRPCKTPTPASSRGPCFLLSSAAPGSLLPRHDRDATLFAKGLFMRLIQVADAVRFPRMTTEELRTAFLVDGLFAPGCISLAYVDLDRTVVGSAVPLDSPLTLESDPDLRAD